MISKPNTLNRVLVALVNFLLLILFAFVFDALVTSRIATSLDGYKDIKNQYDTLQVEYADLQDKYGIYVYNEDNTRIVNPNLTEEEKQAFLEDARVVEIKDIVVNLSKEIKLYTYIPLIISYVSMAAIVYLLPSLFFKKRQNIGMKSFNIVLLKHEETPSRMVALGYLAIYAFFHLIVGLATLFIFNIIDIVYANFDQENHRTLLEKIFNYDFAIDPDKLEAELLSEEKVYEMTHKQDDEK